MKVETPRSFSLSRTVLSHGWFDLPPFRWEPRSGSLHRVIRMPWGGALALEARGDGPGSLEVKLGGPPGGATARQRREARRQVRWMLRLDEPLGEFHSLCRSTPGYEWISRRRAGRLLRAPDPFEDLVKLICTTNCSWALTRTMVRGLVEGLGARASVPRGAGLAARSFPTPEEMADAPARFYRDRLRAGYRAPHLRELARRVAGGEIRPARWTEPGKSPDEIQREIRSIRGAGAYVAENMLKLLGCYEGLALDSWCRRKFSQMHARGRKVSDRTIERHYDRFGRWRGLALWCDLTKDWRAPATGQKPLLAGEY